MNSFEKTALKSLVTFGNGKSIPDAIGEIEAFGGNGVIGKVPEPNYPKRTIIIGRVGSQCGNVHQSNNPCWVTDNALAGVPKKDSDFGFLYYLLNQLRLNELKVGSGQPLVTQTILNSISVEIPSSPDYRSSIAKVLSSLDAKIELNNRINAELEAMAKLLYDYWFVQFDFPMTAAQATALGQPQLAGQPYKTSGGKMVFNPTLKREIPEGWEAGALGSVCSMTRGVTYNKDDVLSNLDPCVTPILRATNVTGSTIDTNDMVYIPEELVAEKQLMSKDDILIVMSSGSKNHIGKNAPYYFEHKVAFGAFCSKITPKPSHRSFVKTSMQSQHFNGHIRNVCLGTNINNLTTSHISDYSTIMPAKEVLIKFEEALQSSYEMIGNNQKQNQELTELRDWLLPMLMNGQVTVGVND